MKRNGRRQFEHIEWVELKRRYKNRCVRCGKKEDKSKEETILTADHVIPVSMGGSKNIGNIQPLCRRCNQTKGSDIKDYRGRKFKD